MCDKFVKTKTIYNKEEKIWLGPETIIDFNLESSIGKVVLENLLKNPKHISQICHNNGNQYTNQDIATLSIRCAQHFKKLGLKQCDVFGICASNTDYLAPLFFGGMLSGLTASTLDPSFDKDGIKHTFSMTKPKIMFCDGSIYEIVHDALMESGLKIPIYTMKDHLVGVKEISEFIIEARNESGYKSEALLHGVSQIAAILCSSGTTGPPKGVNMSHESLLRNTIFSMDTNDKIFCFSTLYWLSGLFVLLNGTIQGAKRIIIDQTFTPKLFLEIIEKYEIDITSTPPSQLATCLALSESEIKKLRSLKSFLCGGSTVPYVFVEKVKKLRPDLILYIGYGMSELSNLVTMGECKKRGEVGQLLPNSVVKIIDDTKKSCAPDEIGEICIKPPFKWSGYCDNLEATNDIYDQNGWIHSGDLGSFDKNGILSVVGRKKEIMKYNNFHFSPSMIEEVICELPGVAEVCVCGIPDPIASYLPAAAVVKIVGCTLTEDDVIIFVKQKLPHFSHLHGGIYFVESIPKTASGKYLRSKVQNICENLRDS